MAEPGTREFFSYNKFDGRFTEKYQSITLCPSVADRSFEELSLRDYIHSQKVSYTGWKVWKLLENGEVEVFSSATAHPRYQHLSFEELRILDQASSRLVEGDVDMIDAPDGDNAAHFRLLDLPAEIRNNIYDFAVGWPDFENVCAKLLDRRKEDLLHVHGRWLDDYPRSMFSTTHLSLCEPLRGPSFSTPPILLVCRQIAAEVQHVLYKKPLVLDRLFMYISYGGPRAVWITDVMSPVTWRRIHHFVFKYGFGFDGSRSRPYSFAYYFAKTIPRIASAFLFTPHTAKITFDLTDMTASDVDEIRNWVS